MTGPNERSMKYLRGRGWIVEMTSSWNRWARVRKDLFGFGDVLAMREAPAVSEFAQVLLIVQSTTASHSRDRVKKILASEKAQNWLRLGHRIEVHGWAKKGARGKRKTWQVNVKDIRL